MINFKEKQNNVITSGCQYGMENKEMLQQIIDKLGFDVRDYNANDSGNAHERDNIPNPFDKLSLDELLFLRENNYFLS